MRHGSFANNGSGQPTAPAGSPARALVYDRLSSRACRRMFRLPRLVVVDLVRPRQARATTELRSFVTVHARQPSPRVLTRHVDCCQPHGSIIATVEQSWITFGNSVISQSRRLIRLASDWDRHRANKGTARTRTILHHYCTSYMSGRPHNTPWPTCTRIAPVAPALSSKPVATVPYSRLLSSHVPPSARALSYTLQRKRHHHWRFFPPCEEGHHRWRFLAGCLPPRCTCRPPAFDLRLPPRCACPRSSPRS